MSDDRKGPQRWANEIIRLLDAVFPGTDRFPVDVTSFALDFSRQRFPTEPIKRVDMADLDGCEGALVPSRKVPRRWGIFYDAKQSAERARFTVAHELGHYLVHRHDLPEGIRCNEEVVERRNGKGIEREADEFAATLLMPLHDFRAQIPPAEKTNFEYLGMCADRYGVSLTAAILRWLEYTERRAMLIVSRDGYALWSRSSASALKSGRFIRTSAEPYELPPGSCVAQEDFTDETRAGIAHASGVWFEEPVEEMTLFGEKTELALTLLHFNKMDHKVEFEAPDPEDSFDQFEWTNSGRGRLETG